ncbi:MAG: type I restriction endonuclease [Bacteroidales bacterium]|nr:type I restriction endonuclease [Bacteroidales bacterium]
MNENWSEIIDTLQKRINSKSTEIEYQQEIENCLKILGWKSYNKTMQSQVKIHIGNNNSIRPDIVLYKNNIPTLPIEIKRPNNICNIKQESQLTSYMRQLKLNIGLYIGENIQLYYDTPNDLNNPICVFKVEFREDDVNGSIFCEMLSYEKFDITSLEDFCKEHYNQIVARNNLQERFNEFFFSSDANKNIITLIKDKFLKEGFEEKALEYELEKLTFKIERKQSYRTEQKIKKPEIETTNKEYAEEVFSLDGINYYGVGRFVLAVVKQYISEHPNITLEELEERFPSYLSKSKECGIIRSMDFIKKRKDGDHRFFTKDSIILNDGTEVAVYSQWGNSGTIKQKFQNFLRHVETFYHVYSKSK